MLLPPSGEAALLNPGFEAFRSLNFGFVWARQSFPAQSSKLPRWPRASDEALGVAPGLGFIKPASGGGASGACVGVGVEPIGVLVAIGVRVGAAEVRLS